MQNKDCQEKKQDITYATSEKHAVAHPCLPNTDIVVPPTGAVWFGP